jgi:hypothetical protein
MASSSVRSVDPAAQLAAACPPFDKIDPATFPNERLVAQWSQWEGPTHVCRELSRSGVERCLLGFSHVDWATSQPIVIRVGGRQERKSIEQLGLPADVTRRFERIMDVGTVRGQRADWSHYIHGTDLVTLYDAGIEISWPVARCLYAAIKAPLAQLHATGWIHGALRPGRVRLSPTRHVDGTIVPVQLCGYRCTRRLHDWGYAARTELGVVAEAVADLSRHPDPIVDALLQDPAPGAIDVLADLLLDRGEPIDELLADRLQGDGGDAAIAIAKQLVDRRLDDAPAHKDLTALWFAIARLDPLLATG